MKKFTILFFLISMIAISSCKKENEDGWNKKTLLGVWEHTGGSDFIACPDGNNVKIVFTDNDFTEYDRDEDGCVIETEGTSSSYTFDGEMIKLVVDEKSYEITELNSTTLSVNIYYKGQPAGYATYKKI
jgi:hypothetical protein